MQGPGLCPLPWAPPSRPLPSRAPGALLTAARRGPHARGGGGREAFPRPRGRPGLTGCPLSFPSRGGPGAGARVSRVPGGPGARHGRLGAVREPVQGARHDGHLLRHQRRRPRRRAGAAGGGRLRLGAGAREGDVGWSADVAGVGGMRMRRVRRGPGWLETVSGMGEGLAKRRGRREGGSVPGSGRRRTVPTQTATQVPLTLNWTLSFLRLVLRTQDTSRRCARAVARVAAVAVQVPAGLFPAKQPHVAGQLWAGRPVCQDARLLLLHGCFLPAEPALVLARPRSACRAGGSPGQGGPTSLGAPRACCVVRTQGGQRPRGAFFYGRNSYQNHKQKTKPTHTHERGGEGS